MPLTNFGSILNFSEELEAQDQGFYNAVSKNPSCIEYKEMFEQFAADNQKNQKIIQRTRRENVTEMILEPITDFTRAPFCLEWKDAGTMSVDIVFEIARKIEERAERYNTEAAEKIKKTLPEVSRALKLIAKKHTAQRKRLYP